MNEIPWRYSYVVVGIQEIKGCAHQNSIQCLAAWLYDAGQTESPEAAGESILESEEEQILKQRSLDVRHLHLGRVAQSEVVQARCIGQDDGHRLAGVSGKRVAESMEHHVAPIWKSPDRDCGWSDNCEDVVATNAVDREQGRISVVQPSALGGLL